MKRIWILLATLVLAGAALTAAQASNQVQATASMLVTGTIKVSDQGRVAGYRLDHPDKLPKPVVDLLSRFIPQLHFKPVTRHGMPVSAKASMTLRLLARPTADNHYTLSIAGYQFGSTNPSYVLHKDHVTDPDAPYDAVEDHLQGTVYLFMQIDRKGRVTHVYAQQVNLQFPYIPVLKRPEMKQRWHDYLHHMRKELARVAVSSARTWTFKVPKAGPSASQPYWYATLPVLLTRIDTAGQPMHPHRYGEWEPYVPGPSKPIPWLKQTLFTSASGSVDAQVPGTLHTLNRQLQLIGQNGNN